MYNVILISALVWTVSAQDYYYQPRNMTRTTLSGLAAYRSSLTLDWLAAEDSRQRVLAAAYETEPPPIRVISTDCATYPRPAPGKVARLLLELIKNLEGDEGVLTPELVHELVRMKLLVETSAFEAEPDFEALMETPGMMVGEPHTTLPKIVAIVWMLVTDPEITSRNGWCPVKKLIKYLAVTRPRDVAKHMKELEATVARARFVMEDFIQSIAPLNMYQRKFEFSLAYSPKRAKTDQGRFEKIPQTNRDSPSGVHRKRPAHQLALLQQAAPAETSPEAVSTSPQTIDDNLFMLENSASVMENCKIMFVCLCLIINCL